MSFTESDLESLRKEVERAVIKFIGHKDQDIIATCIKCADRAYDRRKCRDRLSTVMDESKARKFADKLMILVDDFKVSMKRNRKRREDENEEKPNVGRKRSRFEESTTDSNVIKTEVPEETPNILSAAKIREMMLTAQQAIAQRKEALGFNGVEDNQMNRPVVSAVVDSAEEKRRRMMELQAKIAARIPNTALSGSALISGITTPALGLGNKPKENVRSVTLDDKGRTIDATTGEVIALAQHTPTLKANVRAKHAQQFKHELQLTNSKKPSQEQSGSVHFDTRLSIKIPARPKRQFHFHEPGKFVQMAQRMRTKSQLQRLQESVSEAAKRTGIASAAKLATIQPKRAVNEANVPDVEWWDAYLLKTGDKPLSYNAILGESEESCDKDLINLEWISNLVEHPIKMRAPTDSDKVPDIPLMLTKKERRKLRRQNRLETQKEEQEKVRLGLAAPAEPKVRLANLMRVLGTDAVQDPSKIEAYVRAQMDKRRKAHEAANAARKLNKDQVRQKKIRKTKEDTSKMVQVAVYRVADLSNPSHKFKVETNCTQLLMTGFVALHRDCNVVVVEGGPNQQRKFKRLMLNRIRWSELGRGSKAVTQTDDSSHKPASSPCVLVWEGSVGRRIFDKIQFKSCPTELFAREQFRKHDVEQYWDQAYSGAILEAAGEEVA